ncbi:MAG: hypothetical protein IKJ35_01970 [Clostridia bacterium]|nr:hypothetical protein [Clostridia bacterium]
MKKMRAAVVGYGGMGGWHVEHLLKSDVCELAGVYDIRREKRACRKPRHPCLRFLPRAFE